MADNEAVVDLALYLSNLFRKVREYLKGTTNYFTKLKAVVSKL
jgi:hypothetical protein